MKRYNNIIKWERLYWRTAEAARTKSPADSLHYSIAGRICPDAFLFCTGEGAKIWRKPGDMQKRPEKEENHLTKSGGFGNLTKLSGAGSARGFGKSVEISEGAGLAWDRKGERAGKEQAGGKRQAREEIERFQKSA